jgi:hypothetical protein
MKSFTGAQITKKSVLGIGNALIDVLITITDDTVLQKFGLPKGSMTLVDARLSAEIKKETKTVPEAFKRVDLLQTPSMELPNWVVHAATSVKFRMMKWVISMSKSLKRIKSIRIFSSAKPEQGMQPP